MLDVIICANFGVEKLRGLGNTRGQILEFPIEINDWSPLQQSPRYRAACDYHRPLKISTDGGHDRVRELGSVDIFRLLL